MNSVRMRGAGVDDLPVLQEIRVAAFGPVFASFRALLGGGLYEKVQAREDEAQGGLLASLLEAGSGWEVFVAEAGGEIAGFVSLQLNEESGVGEIGLNAVHPDFAGRGIGTGMYEFALSRMRATGMVAATVSTGADESHAAARRAYEKAGFARQIPSVWMCREL